ncbi:MAG: site-specific DNA-methyltransferase [Gemmatimonadales bacterium]|nr:site-specific DNA-methyltransferase [Gemmatimonadales bacterium]MYG48362.1 site-specific DNA-methyltransferase [Gemmatimonadales bacterium]MYK01690.1 site-specific DNA-methyltransferase [Candidatus Palauibacter ramosifaciens]
MRHRFHAICPYFAMFPEAFVAAQLEATPFSGVVFDPFCGRGTTVFESLLRGRDAAGCDVHPVAACVAGAKADPPSQQDVSTRLSELEEESAGFDAPRMHGAIAEFFELCFHPRTYAPIAFMREHLDWRRDKTDRFIAALALGSLHGESHRTPNCFSNRMPRTISTKPRYSVSWWRKNGLTPPRRDVFRILRYMTEYRYESRPPLRRGSVQLADAREAGERFSNLGGVVTDIITSPPYLDTTNYREDQWLRLWFLGGEPTDRLPANDGRHYSADKYKNFLVEAWAGVAPLLAAEAIIVVRMGGRRLTKEAARTTLFESLRDGLSRSVSLVDDGASSRVRRTQANAFRGDKPSDTMEHDFRFEVA